MGYFRRAAVVVLECLVTRKSKKTTRDRFGGKVFVYMCKYQSAGEWMDDCCLGFLGVGCVRWVDGDRLGSGSGKMTGWDESW